MSLKKSFIRLFFRILEEVKMRKYRLIKKKEKLFRKKLKRKLELSWKVAIKKIRKTLDGKENCKLSSMVKYQKIAL